MPYLSIRYCAFGPARKASRCTAGGRISICRSASPDQRRKRALVHSDTAISPSHLRDSVSTNNRPVGCQASMPCRTPMMGMRLPSVASFANGSRCTWLQRMASARLVAARATSRMYLASPPAAAESISAFAGKPAGSLRMMRGTSLTWLTLGSSQQASIRSRL